MDGIEREVSDFAQVVRLNIQEPVGRQIAADRGVYLVPTFLVLDGDGSELDRQQGAPDRERLLEALARAAGG